MDVEENGVARDRCGFWTNEKHVSFLNWMEGSFVRRMLENEDRASTLSYAASHRNVAHPPHPPPLNRFIPDRSESTRDSTQRNITTRVRFPAEDADRSGTNNSASRGGGGNNMENNWTTWNLLQPSDDTSQDQVVPQFGAGKVIKGEKDMNERDSTGGVIEVAVAPNKELGEISSKELITEALS